MPLDFPASPTNGQTYNGYVYSTSVGAWQAKPSAQSPFYTSDTPPSNPVAGDAWFNTNDGTMYIYYNDGNTSQWTEHRSEIARSQVGIVPIVPTSVAVGSGTGSVNSAGLVTFTGATYINVNGVIGSTYKFYKIYLEVSSATATAVNNFRYSTAGNATTTGLWYITGGYWGIAGAGTSSATSAGTDYAVNVALASGYDNTKSISEITLTNNRAVANYSGFPNGAGGSLSYGLWNQLNPTHDGFRITQGSGNFTGTLKVYGYN